MTVEPDKRLCDVEEIPARRLQAREWEFLRIAIYSEEDLFHFKLWKLWKFGVLKREMSLESITRPKCRDVKSQNRTCASLRNVDHCGFYFHVLREWLFIWLYKCIPSVWGLYWALLHGSPVIFIWGASPQWLWVDLKSSLSPQRVFNPCLVTLFSYP